MTRSSIVAAIVVTLLLGLLIWWRDEQSPIGRSQRALTPSSRTVSIPVERAPDADAPASR
jgi:hypothetical protein